MGVFCAVSVVALILFAWFGRKSPGSAPTEKPTESTAKRVMLPRGQRVDVVGESHYQKELGRITGGRTEAGHRFATTATLIREPRNRHDKNAVAVEINGLQVGYLSREDAVVFKSLLDDMTKRGETATCGAVIVGGWDRGDRGQGSFGVQLNLVHPDKAPSEASIIATAKTDIWNSKGVASRRAVVRKAMENLWTDESRKLLLVEASRLEVTIAIDKADALKTKAAKRRRLQDALEALKTDEVPDDLQQEQIKWLEAAIRELDGSAEEKAEA